MRYKLRYVGDSFTVASFSWIGGLLVFLKAWDRPQPGKRMIIECRTQGDHIEASGNEWITEQHWLSLGS